MVALPNVSRFLRLDNGSTDKGKLLSIVSWLELCKESSMHAGTPRGGALQISSDGDDRRNFFG